MNEVLAQDNTGLILDKSKITKVLSQVHSLGCYRWA